MTFGTDLPPFPFTSSAGSADAPLTLSFLDATRPRSSAAHARETNNQIAPKYLGFKPKLRKVERAPSEPLAARMLASFSFTRDEPRAAPHDVAVEKMTRAYRRHGGGMAIPREETREAFAPPKKLSLVQRVRSLGETPVKLPAIGLK